MRLNEFADPEKYSTTATDADDFFVQLMLMWPDQSVDDPTSSILGHKRQRPIKWTELSDALSVGSRVGGGDLRRCCRASQWPTA
jgi:hypothetical protein